MDLYGPGGTPTIRTDRCCCNVMEEKSISISFGKTEEKAVGKDEGAPVGLVDGLVDGLVVE